MPSDTQTRLLNKIADINKDASQFYKSAVERVESPNLARTLRELGNLHDYVVSDVMRHLTKQGQPLDLGGTFSGKTSQFFGELRASLGGDVDAILVSRLEEAEDRCLHYTQEALNDDSIDNDTRILLQGELLTLSKTHNYMRSLKECLV